MNFLDPRLPKRFWDKCIPEPNSGCWLWIGTLSAGYGQLRWPTGGSASPVTSAHRVMCEGVGKTLDEVTDHRCETKCCVNPAHLDPCSNAENVRRHHLRHPVTHCPAGHEYTDDNRYVYWHATQQRTLYHCKLCHSVQQQRSAAKRLRRRLARMTPAKRAAVLRRQASAARLWAPGGSRHHERVVRGSE